ncbi:MAG: hypothetical protein Q8Q54_16525 [Methylococcales bacterium]|nr:hypothetical protein [Methylococcales bacterium]MDP3840525.1 hypothetical protein [Methylococcales bacterium]
MKIIQCAKCRQFGTFANENWASTCDNCGSQRKIIYGKKQIFVATCIVVAIVIGAVAVQYQKPPSERNWGPLNGLGYLNK